ARGERSLLYLLSLAAFLLALLAKSVVVILPLVLILYDLSFQKRNDVKGLLLDKLPFVIMAVIFSLVAVESQSVQYLGGKTTWHGGSPYATLLTMLPVLATYLRQVVWPAGLSAFYDVPIRTGIDAQVVGAAVLCLILLTVGVMLYLRRRDLFFWYALFFAGLIPVSQIVPIVTLMNDRYLYFPMLGGAPFLCAALAAGAEKVKMPGARREPAVLALLLLVIGLFAVTSYQRTEVWQNSATLWGDAVKKAPKVALTHDCFGEGLLQQGKLDEAISEFRVAIGLEPAVTAANLSAAGRYALANTHNNLGTAYGIKGMTDAAMGEFFTAIRLNPDLGKAYFNLGNAMMHKGMAGQALQCFAKAVSLEPDNPAFAANFRMTRDLLTHK
ncbi:MAG TPA: tetratricopeptide repeat protein, partial [Geobacteraceae bacterium]